jgi:hypothetical protein
MSGSQVKELFRFTRQTKFTKVSISGKHVLTFFPNKFTLLSINRFGHIIQRFLISLKVKIGRRLAQTVPHATRTAYLGTILRVSYAMFAPFFINNEAPLPTASSINSVCKLADLFSNALKQLLDPAIPKVKASYHANRFVI